MDNIKKIKAYHQWNLLNGDTPPPEDIEEWYDEEIVTTEADVVVGYSEGDIQEELNFLDSYEEIGYSEDSENSQQLTLDLMNQYE
tara:strand:- start:1687 stop:1941 length:255 start_codon:yes stop_codon:yes gene_type:complete